MNIKGLVKVIAVALLFTCCKETYAQYLPLVDYEPFRGISQNRVILQDGNYEAIVDYDSHTGYSARYGLIVSVRNDRVVAIHFSNGGYIHTGINEEGYSYRGGELSPFTDYSGDIIAMKGTVTISQYYYDDYAIPHSVTDVYRVTIQ